MQKTVQMPFKQVDINFKSKVLDPLRKVVMSITPSQQPDHENNEDDVFPAFKLVFNKRQHESSIDLTYEEEKQLYGGRYGDDDEFNRSRASERRGYSLRDFMIQMQTEKLYTPPIRIVFAGDDKQFN